MSEPVRTVEDADLGLTLHVLGDEGAGPVLAVLAGVHGDEPEGPLAASSLIADLTGQRLQGAVRVVTVANPDAFAARARCNPVDGLNLARVFPGDPAGSPTERVAAWLRNHLVEGADLLVDLHSAGAHYEMPLFVGYDASAPAADRAAAAAEAFGAPLIWRHPRVLPGRSLHAAADLGVPAIYAEGSGGGRVRGADLALYRDGLARLVTWLGLLPTGPAPAPAVELISWGDGDVDSSIEATADGYCVTYVEVGSDVRDGDLIAEIRTVDDGVVQTVRAPRPARVMMLRRTAPIRSGEGVVMLAPREEAP